MSKRYEVELDREAVKELLNDPAITDTCVQVANVVRQRCGKGYSVQTLVSSDRTKATFVFPANNEAELDNLRNNTLLRAVD